MSLPGRLTARPSCALTALWLAACSLAAQAQTGAPKAATFDPMVVTATRTPQPIAELLADITVVGADEIARSGVQSLAELLQRQPGVEIVQNGGAGSSSGVFLRGTNRGQTLILIDGLRVSSSSVGATTLEAIPLSEIDRIEILRGPASSLYGSDAIGGVIQVFTRRGGSSFSANASAGYGTYSTTSVAGGVSGAVGPLRFAVQANGKRSDGFNAIVNPGNVSFNGDADGYENDGYSASATLTWAPGQELIAQGLHSRMNSQFDGGPDADDRTITTLDVWSVRSVNKVNGIWTSRLAAGQGSDDSLSKTGFGDFPFKTTQTQYSWLNDLTLPLGLLTLGAERREERIDTDAGFGVTGRNTNGYFGIWQFTKGGHALQANLRRDDISQFGGKTTGAIAYGYRFSPAWRVTAGYGTAFKAPSFNDLYYPGFSNANLVPETSSNVEGGVYWNGVLADATVETRAVAYHNRVKSLIVFQCDSNFFNCAPQNVDRATLEGVTLGVDASWRDTTLKASLDLQSPEDDLTGRLLPRRARVHGAVSLLQTWGAWQLGAEFVASSYRYDDAENRRRMGGYGILNLTAQWTVAKGLALFVRADNVFDKNYELAADYSTGGAQVFAGVRWAM
jgi:vitamin B12 transporter